MVNGTMAVGHQWGKTREQKQSQPCLRLDKKDFIQNLRGRDQGEIDETQQEQFNNIPYLLSVHFRATHRSSGLRRVSHLSRAEGEL
jgi:hypothetical protein